MGLRIVQHSAGALCESGTRQLCGRETNVGLLCRALRTAHVRTGREPADQSLAHQYVYTYTLKREKSFVLCLPSQNYKVFKSESTESRNSASYNRDQKIEIHFFRSVHWLTLHVHLCFLQSSRLTFTALPHTATRTNSTLSHRATTTLTRPYHALVRIRLISRGTFFSFSRCIST